VICAFGLCFCQIAFLFYLASFYSLLSLLFISFFLRMFASFITFTSALFLFGFFLLLF